MKSILIRSLSHGKYNRILPVFSRYHEQMVKALILIHNGWHNPSNSKLDFPGIREGEVPWNFRYNCIFQHVSLSPLSTKLWSVILSCIINMKTSKKKTLPHLKWNFIFAWYIGVWNRVKLLSFIIKLLS